MWTACSVSPENWGNTHTGKPMLWRVQAEGVGPVPSMLRALLSRALVLCWKQRLSSSVRPEFQMLCGFSLPALTLELCKPGILREAGEGLVEVEADIKLISELSTLSVGPHYKECFNTVHLKHRRLETLTCICISWVKFEGGGYLHGWKQTCLLFLN